jgi:hypothetical protein
VNRIDIIRFENSPDEKVLELIEKGEAELHILIDTKNEIVTEARGGFYIAQMICSEICQRESLLETSSELRLLSTSFEGVKSAIWRRLSDNFSRFARLSLWAPATDRRVGHLICTY